MLDADIKGCFDSISHDWMLRHIPMDKTVLRKWLQAGFEEKAQWFPTEAGTPQGGIASPTLANMVLDGLQNRLASLFKLTRWNRTRFNPKVHLVRYADDFVITGTDKGVLEQVLDVVTSFLAERGLTLSPEKTRIVHVSEGFDFLGFNIRAYNGKLLIKPAKDGQNRMHRKVREIISGNKSGKQRNLIMVLNPVIKGWANYYRHCTATRTFSKLDMVLWRTLWQWTKRRHPNKGRRWIAERYFRFTWARRWIFAVRDGLDHRGRRRWTTLVKASDTKFFRHAMVRADANPYDPQWSAYFESRTRSKMPGSSESGGALKRLEPSAG